MTTILTKDAMVDGHPDKEYVTELRCPMCGTAMPFYASSPFCSWCGFDVVKYYADRINVTIRGTTQ